MSQSSYALRQRRKLYLTRGVAATMAVALVAAIALGAADLSGPADDVAPAKTGEPAPAEAGSAKPSEILAPGVASAALDSAITGLLAAERFRFELHMRPISGGGETSWRVTGEADVATSLDDPPRLRAQVAIGSGDAYSVISDQVRIGEALFNRDPESGAYVSGAPAGSEELGAVDPVTTILASLRELPASQFEEVSSTAGTRTVLVRAGRHSIEGDITSMRIVLDNETGALSSMRFRSKAMTSRVAIWDLGDPSIDIQVPR